MIGQPQTERRESKQAVLSCIFIPYAVAQLVEALRYSRKVMGSIPGGVTEIFH